VRCPVVQPCVCNYRRKSIYTTLWGRPQKWDSVNRALDKFAYALALLALKLSNRRVRLDCSIYSFSKRVLTNEISWVRGIWFQKSIKSSSILLSSL